MMNKNCVNQLKHDLKEIAKDGYFLYHIYSNDKINKSV